MKHRIAVAVGLFYVVMGVSLAIAPQWFTGVTDWTSRQGQLIAASIRIVVGIALLLAASTSRYPRTLKVFGAIALFAGLVMPFVPIEAWAEYLTWWFGEGLSLMRWVGAVGGILFGGFVLHAMTPRGSKDE